MENRSRRVTLGQLIHSYHHKSVITSKSPCKRTEPYQNLEMPISAMEFLCRSWSPSASGLLQSFSLQDSAQERRQQNKDDDDQNTNFTYENANVKYPKGLREFLSMGRGFCSRGREETRLANAKIHAALSLAQLAAAIAGYVGAETNQTQNMEMNMGSAVAYAAAMVATACAESAELTGAQKVHVDSAVNSGMRAQNPADFITLVASAATSLRGVATLRLRHVSATEKSSLLVVKPSGERVKRTVSVYTKHGKAKLVVEKKCVGCIKTRSEYVVLHAEVEASSDRGCMIHIRSERKDIKLLFESEQQMNRWMACISPALRMR